MLFNHRYTPPPLLFLGIPTALSSHCNELLPATQFLGARLLRGRGLLGFRRELAERERDGGDDRVVVRGSPDELERTPSDSLCSTSLSDQGRIRQGQLEPVRRFNVVDSLSTAFQKDGHARLMQFKITSSTTQPSAR